MEVILDGGGRLIPLQPGGESSLSREGGISSDHLASHGEAPRRAVSRKAHGRCRGDNDPSGCSLTTRKTAQAYNTSEPHPNPLLLLCLRFRGNQLYLKSTQSGMPSMCQELF